MPLVCQFIEALENGAVQGKKKKKKNGGGENRREKEK